MSNTAHRRVLSITPLSGIDVSQGIEIDVDRTTMHRLAGSLLVKTFREGNWTPAQQADVEESAYQVARRMGEIMDLSKDRADSSPDARTIMGFVWLSQYAMSQAVGTISQGDPVVALALSEIINDSGTAMSLMELSEDQQERFGDLTEDGVSFALDCVTNANTKGCACGKNHDAHPGEEGHTPTSKELYETLPKEIQGMVNMIAEMSGVPSDQVISRLYEEFQAEKASRAKATITDHGVNLENLPQPVQEAMQKVLDAGIPIHGINEVALEGSTQPFEDMVQSAIQIIGRGRALQPHQVQAIRDQLEPHRTRIESAEGGADLALHLSIPKSI